jgi:hypothetical protein
MSRLRLGLYELREYELPDVCMKCGRKAVARPSKTFAWSPPWIIVLIFAGLLPYVLVAMILTKRVTMTTPFCERHRNYWLTRALITWGGFLALIVIGVGGFVLLSVFKEEGNNVGGFFCFGLIVVGLVWLITVAVLQQSGIGPKEITDRSITLVGVSPDFVDALREEQRDDEDEDDRRRRRDEDEEGRPRKKRRTDDDDGGYYDPDEKRPRRPRREDDER